MFRNQMKIFQLALSLLYDYLSSSLRKNIKNYEHIKKLAYVYLYLHD